MRRLGFPAVTGLSGRDGSLAAGPVGQASGSLWCAGIHENQLALCRPIADLQNAGTASILVGSPIPGSCDSPAVTELGVGLHDTAVSWPSHTAEVTQPPPSIAARPESGDGMAFFCGLLITALIARRKLRRLAFPP